MTWASELDELRRRQAFADQMGGMEGIERQHRAGKLTVRERLPLLADPGTFRQFNSLKGEGRYGDDGQLESVLPDGKVEGMCRIDGRKVVVTAGDFTVRGGSADVRTSARRGRYSSGVVSSRITSWATANAEFAAGTPV